MIKTLAAMLFSVLLCPGRVVTASAQQSTTEGWVFGFDLGRTAVSFENAPSDAGGQYAIRVGYGLNRIVTLYLGIDEAEVDIQGFDQFDKMKFRGSYNLGARLHLTNISHRWVPYGDFALTDLILEDVSTNREQNTSDRYEATAVSLGGGLAIYLSDAWALDVNFKWSKGEFKNVRVGNNSVGGLHIDAESSGFTIGVLWWP